MPITAAMPSPRRNVFAVTVLLALLIPASAAAASWSRAVKVPTSFLNQLARASQPSGLRVSSATPSAITISWKVAKLKQSRYNVYLDGSLRGSTTATTYTFSSLLCGKSYTVGIGSTTTKGPQLSMVVPTSACVGTAAPPADLQPPSIPIGLTVSGAAASSIGLTWSPSTDNVAVAGYEVSVGGTVAGSTTSLGYTLTGLQCGSAYQASVDAIDWAGNRSAAATLTAATAACPDTLAPQQPPNLFEASATATSLGISWSRPLDNVGVTGYTISLNGGVAVRTTNPGYVYTGLNCGTSYQVSVRASDAAGNLSPAASVTAGTTVCADSTAPTAPADVQWVSATASTVTVSWSTATDNIGVSGYTVYLNGNQFQTVQGTGPLTISNLACATSSKVAVDAYDAAGNHSTRTQVTALTTACAPAADATPPGSPGTLTSSNTGDSGFTVGWVRQPTMSA